MVVDLLFPQDYFFSGGRVEAEFQPAAVAAADTRELAQRGPKLLQSLPKVSPILQGRPSVQAQLTQVADVLLPIQYEVDLKSIARRRKVGPKLCKSGPDLRPSKDAQSQECRPKLFQAIVPLVQSWSKVDPKLRQSRLKVAPTATIYQAPGSRGCVAR